MKEFHYREACTLKLKKYADTLVFWTIWEFIKRVGTSTIEFKKNCPLCVIKTIKDCLQSLGFEVDAVYYSIHILNGELVKQEYTGFDWKKYDAYTVNLTEIPEKCIISEIEESE